MCCQHLISVFISSFAPFQFNLVRFSTRQQDETLTKYGLLPGLSNGLSDKYELIHCIKPNICFIFSNYIAENLWFYVIILWVAVTTAYPAAQIHDGVATERKLFETHAVVKTLTSHQGPGFKSRPFDFQTTKNMYARLTFSQYPWPQHWLKIWAWSVGTACWLLTAPHWLVKCRAQISLYKSTYAQYSLFFWYHGCPWHLELIRRLAF